MRKQSTSPQYLTREQYLNKLTERPIMTSSLVVNSMKNALRRGYPTREEDRIVSGVLKIPSFYQAVYPAEQRNQCIKELPERNKGGEEESESLLNYSLRTARIFSGYSIRDLSRKTGIGYSALTSYEHMRAMPDERTARKIVEVFNGELRKNRKCSPRRHSNNLEERMLTEEDIFPKKYYGVCEEINKMKKEDEDYTLRLDLGLLVLYDPQKMDGFSERNPETARAIEHTHLRKDILEALGEIGQKEKAVLILRHGLGGEGTPLTAEEVGKKLRMSRERIRQIESRGLERLYKVSKRMGLI